MVYNKQRELKKTEEKATMKAAIIQICSKLDPNTNLAKISELINAAKTEQPALEAVFLPEVFYSMSDGTKPTPYLIEEGNEHFQNIADLAKKHNVYLLGGSAATKKGSGIVNRSYNFNPAGELIAQYDKIHLFTIDLAQDRTVLDEAKVYTKGSELSDFKIGQFHFGLSICFDLRFPELYRKYYAKGVNVFTISSAFTVPTGKAHWLTLLKARAIENQSYVIASDQWGEHNDKMKTWGHSYVIDPWGEVVAECGEGENFALFELDYSLIEKIRGRMTMASRLT